MRTPISAERLYLDFDSFFASVEQQARPEFRGRPVGVIPIDSPNTCVIAASREAKTLGVKTGTSVREARRLCPNIALPVARPDLYTKINRTAVSEVAQVVPVLHVRSIDELVGDIAGWSHQEVLARARQIKERLAHAIGPFITCSIGLAANELLAKVAAESQKPNGLVLFAPETMPGPLFSFRLTDLPGIASGLSRRLNTCGVWSVADLWRLSPKQARMIWGSVEGERFWAALHGYAIERPETQRRMFGHSRVLAPDWRTLSRARACARLLLVKAARRMRREKFAARALTVTLREGHGSAMWGREIHFHLAIDDRYLLSRLDEIWPRVWPSETRSAHPKFVSVSLHNLAPAHACEGNLFEDEQGLRDRHKREALSNALDALNRRFGRDVVSFGPRLSLPGGFAGAKIAFGRIPHAEDF